ncbi:hypothetical protein GH714_029697 [Hevea brasiliensis]|uniref:Cytochrome P450 n=1 Tax=Hevea brasiliensis TaxID=3981 RepID=A0A6A6M4V2_HEVBR|nr:hypothetical protein GH714_029687 [Hevea brasiliensis]KAF2307551.1 hypothetical protein GH714_029697 [Hevea brasiliensis]
MTKDGVGRQAKCGRLLACFEMDGSSGNQEKYGARLGTSDEGCREVRERKDCRESIGEREDKDFLDVLLEYEGNEKEEPDKISTRNILVTILEVFLGGSGTSGITIEWALAELLRHPKSMRTVNDEINRVVGSSKKVEERDNEELLYPQALIKETVRLHPVNPLLLPRNTLEDGHFVRYRIPKDAQVLVNAWAIGRDPDT